jgi:hypothetical protein
MLTNLDLSEGAVTSKLTTFGYWVNETRPDGRTLVNEVTGLDRLLAVDACTRLMTEYAYRLDNGLGSTVSELFTEDGEWSSPEVGNHGRAELAAFFARRDAMAERITRHVVTNIDITMHDADRASARSVAIEYRGERGPDGRTADTAPALVGDYLDEFHRVEGTWYFHRRRVVLDFTRSGEVLMRPLASG